LSDNEIKDYQLKKTIVNAALDWTDLRLSEQVKTVRFFRDKDNNIVCMPVIMLDPAQAPGNIRAIGKVGIADGLITASYARCYGAVPAGWLGSTVGLVTHSTKMLLRGEVPATATLEAQRTPTTFKTLAGIVAAGESVAIWTPAAGNRIHLMGGTIIVSVGATTAAAAQLLDLHIGGALLPGCSFQLNTGALGATVNYGIFSFQFPGNGYRMAAINTELRLNLSVAFTAGCVTVNLYGYEEIG